MSGKVKYLGARLTGFVMIAAIVAFVLGFFSGNHVLTIVGGLILVVMDLQGIAWGFLKSGFPVVAAVIAAFIFQPWYYGVFWASALFEFLNIPTRVVQIARPDISARRLGYSDDEGD